MLEIALINEGWDTGTNWDALAEKAARAAVFASPFAALLSNDVPAEIAIRLTSDVEVHALNRDYREQDKPTNVLSFPMLEPDELERAFIFPMGEVMLGDLVLAQGVCSAEAAERSIPVEAHATHLIIHGVLHLLGFDHIEDEEAETMEGLERQILGQLGLHDPYED